MNLLDNINSEIKYSDYKIIVADTNLYTFNELAKIKQDFCFINLSSDFAVSFVLEYEKIDYLLVSNRINNLNNLIAKAQKKKIKIFILGKEIEYPLNSGKISEMLIKEINNNLHSVKKNYNVKEFFRDLLTFKLNNNGRHIDNTLNKKVRKNTAGKGAGKLFYKSVGNSVLNEVSKKIDENEAFKESNQTVKVLKNAPENKLLKQENHKENLNTEKITQNVYKDTSSFDSVNIKSAEHVFGSNSRFITNRKLKKIEYQIKTVKQKIIAVTKAKGGVGGTIISIFLGLLFKELKTLLIDLNFNEGGSDIGYYLDIPKTPNITVFTEGYDKDAFYSSILNIIDNLDVIQSPSTYIQSKEIDLKDIYSLTDIARKKYDLIIFDLPNYIDEFYLGIIDLADLLVMVSDCTTGSIGRLLNLNSKYVFDELEKILIINKYNKFNSLKISIESLKDYFNINKIATLKELDVLNSKSDFKSFNFNNFDDFKNLSSIATEILTK